MGPRDPPKATSPIRLKKDKLTGARTNDAPRYHTEHPLGGPTRGRLASYDSATLGLSRRVSDRVRLESWEFPGWGSHFRMTVPQDELRLIEEEHEKHHPKLGEWAATAICGNDILSSVLYVSGLVTSSAGWLSPVCLLMVAGLLYLYRFIYGEAISALPMNGGSYNVLINTTSKAIASFAACLAIISYIATGVVSAATAIAYLRTLWPELDAQLATVALLFFFACLMGYGISESSDVALGMFVLHVATLFALAVGAAAYACFETTTFHENIQRDFPDIIVGGNLVQGNWATALLFGFSSAMLGVSGFESSSQNMWMGVAVFNPVLCLLSFCVLQMDEIVAHRHSMLALMANRVGYWLSDRAGLLGYNTQSFNLGVAFEAWVSLDAFIVLSGAVLTAYVGITGLIRRMAMDRCLPQFLLRTNEWRGTNHFIIFGFFVLATTQVYLLRGDITLLSGVYTFAFLGVMSIFSSGCIILKFKRPKLPRDVTVSYAAIAIGLTFVLTAFVGNMISKPEILSYFSLYFIAVGLVVLSVFQRIRILKVNFLKEQISELRSQPYLFFCKADDLYTINKAILYVRENEQTDRLLVVHVSPDTEGGHIKALSNHIMMFDTMYPRIKISLLTVEGTFSPALIEWLSRELAVPKNMMFITCPDAVFKYKIEKLGGVRVITH
ncbi:amino acid permease-domain-containing protein [Tribonema minus]|uniref:Amino acid permease-domain-containing protein n=1 Tax=Tribonema minus TaxID=303371 RepID=A0A836CNH3_9STRA|nr:amino acid permease-domain-containing protein [Tribonema minus]